MANIKLRLKIVDTEADSFESEKGFKKQSIIGVIEGEYPEHYKIDFLKEKTKLVDELIEGTYQTFHCNVKGRKVEKAEKEAMYFISLECYKIGDN